MIHKTFNEVFKSILTAISLVVGLAWNDAFKSTIDSTPKLKKWGPWAYALFITLFSVFLSTYLSKYVNEDKT